MFAVAEVYETDIGLVRVGQKARLTSGALAREVTGVVAAIGRTIHRTTVLDVDPAADVDSRIVEVRIKLDESEAGGLPDELASAHRHPDSVSGHAHRSLVAEPRRPQDAPPSEGGGRHLPDRADFCANRLLRRRAQYGDRDPAEPERRPLPRFFGVHQYFARRNLSARSALSSRVGRRRRARRPTLCGTPRLSEPDHARPPRTARLWDRSGRADVSPSGSLRPPARSDGTRHGAHRSQQPARVWASTIRDDDPGREEARRNRGAVHDWNGFRGTRRSDRHRPDVLENLRRPDSGTCQRGPRSGDARERRAGNRRAEFARSCRRTFGH